MELQIQHLCHPEHPLILIDSKDNTRQGPAVCKGCGIVILESSYSCTSCDFHLHLLCANLPTDLKKHPDHDPGHPLTLTVRAFSCDVCFVLFTGMTYHCRSCNFDVDLRCVAQLQSLDHKGHQHPPRPILSTALFECHACGSEHAAGLSYKCDTCSFWIHEECAALPTTIKYHRHVHPLSLVPSHENRYAHLLSSCVACRMEIRHKNQWYFQCHCCIHKIHVNCLTKIINSERNNTDRNEIDDIDLAKLFEMPTSIQYNDLMRQLIERMGTSGSREELELGEGGTLAHFSHKHPLTLHYEEINSEVFYSGNQKNKKNEKICNACVLPVSAPLYYSCGICNNYFLHKWCAELPKELHNPFHHPHPLILKATQLDHSYCDSCWGYTNGFIYQCIDDQCDYYKSCGERFVMDIKCLCLPLAISHNVHQHPLKIQKNCYNEGCVACPNRSEMLAYGCDKCCFYLHYTCALQPTKINHRYDKHPFILYMDGPIEDGPVEYVCELCEKDIAPMWWFYYCIDCDQSACADCIFKKDKRQHCLNKHVTYLSDIHNHPLTLVPLDLTNVFTPCSLCHTSLALSGYGLQCGQCNIMFHHKVCEDIHERNNSRHLQQEERSPIP